MPHTFFKSSTGFEFLGDKYKLVALIRDHFVAGSYAVFLKINTAVTPLFHLRRLALILICEQNNIAILAWIMGPQSYPLAARLRYDTLLWADTVVCIPLANFLSQGLLEL